LSGERNSVVICAAWLISDVRQKQTHAMDKNTYLIALSESPESDYGKRDFADQSNPQKVFSAIWQLESDVCNGGFGQYFTNCWGDPSVKFAPEALRTIGAHKCAAIVDQAMALLPPGIPDDFDERSDFFESEEALSAALSEIDTKFYAYPDKLTELLFAFVTKHPDEFGPTPVL
jgi:hypothetical protein